MYIVIIGAGRTGSSVIELANRDNQDVVVVERDPEIAEEISTTYDCMVINADATSKEILLEAGIEEADALISTTDDESVNLMVSMLGKQYDVETIVSSIENPDHIELFRDLGVSVVESPHRLNGRYLYRAVKRPEIEDLMDITGPAEIFELTVDDNAPIAGHNLVEAYDEGLIGDDTIVVAVRHDGELTIPDGQTVIESGASVTVLARSGATDRVIDPFNGT
ncbi:MAG: TrkA family potassium uptake protein [bacterium]